MKLGTMAAIAALAVAMTLGAKVTPADAGNKAKKQAHHQGSNAKHADGAREAKKRRGYGHVRYAPGLTTDKLETLEKKLRGQKDLKHFHKNVERQLERSREKKKTLGLKESDMEKLIIGVEAVKGLTTH